MRARITAILVVFAMASAAHAAVIAYYTGDGSSSWVSSGKYNNGWNTAADGSGTDLTGTVIDAADTVYVTQGTAWANVDMPLVSVVNITGTGILKIQRNGLVPSLAVDGGSLMATTQYNNSTKSTTTLTISGAGVTFLGNAAATTPDALNILGVVSGTAPVNINGGRIQFSNAANNFVSTVNVGTGAALLMPQAQNTINGNDVVLAPGGVYWMYHNGSGWNTTNDIYGTNGSNANQAWWVFGNNGSTGPWGVGGNKDAEFRGVTFGAGPKENGDGTGLLKIASGFKNDDTNQDGTGVANTLNVWVGDGTADKIVAGLWSIEDSHGSAVTLQLQFAPGWTDGSYLIVDRTGWAWGNQPFINDTDQGGGVFQATGTYDGYAWSCDVAYAGGDDNKDIVISNIAWVPEPASLGVLCMGGLALLMRRRR
ncbi:MAG TPA: PEP-CTERM sorting domain-containing protein [Phycisphaerae bacterium]|nr:PEP-CTERM sorting domain-containing protein [Phycisphaerae bacterium]